MDKKKMQMKENSGLDFIGEGESVIPVAKDIGFSKEAVY